MAKKDERDVSDPTSQPAGETATFEACLAALEQAVQRLEAGDLDLSQALDLFETGVRSLKACYQRLDAAERRIERLTGVDAEGNPITEPFDDASLSLEEKQEARGRRRTHDGSASKSAPRRKGGDDNSVDEGSRLF